MLRKIRAGGLAKMRLLTVHCKNYLGTLPWYFGYKSSHVDKTNCLGISLRSIRTEWCNTSRWYDAAERFCGLPKPRRQDIELA